MNFEFSLNSGKAKRVMPNKMRASSLFKSSIQAIETAKEIPLTINTSKSILRELYEGLREYCEAIGYLYGYKFLDHESIGFFLRDILKEHSLFKKFDRYRKLRNRINYYGHDIEIETVKEAISEIPKLIRELEKHNATLQLVNTKLNIDLRNALTNQHEIAEEYKKLANTFRERRNVDYNTEGITDEEMDVARR